MGPPTRCSSSVERDAAEIILRNLRTTRLEARGRVRQASVAALLPRLVDEGPFDLVFADPPYATEHAEVQRLLEVLAHPGMMHGGASLVLERSSRAEELEPGPGWQIEWSRSYGDTLVVVATR